MGVEERVANLEQAFLALNRLAKRDDERHEFIGQSINLLTELIRRHDARLGEIEAEQSNTDARVAALADAQVRTEDALARLSAAQTETQAALRDLTAQVSALTEAQARTDRRLTSLIDSLGDAAH